MATASKAKTEATGPATRGLKVIARCESFRRAGLVFGAEPITCPLDGPNALTAEQVEAISSEKLLVAQEVDIEPAKE